jgi:mannose-1-phosphate guanylyltransferase/phosphomannomutase
VAGTRTKDDVWVGAGADIDPSVEISPKAVIGANTRVRAGTRIGPYTIIGDNCMIGADVEMEHAIVWDDCFLGANSSVRGAVLCRGVDLRAGARAEQGAVIGDETMVGHGATVGTDVQVYPFKRIDSGALVTSSIIWESRGVRSLFGDDGISGLVNIDITPELALRVAQAYGSLLPGKSHVVVSRDASRAARMLKRAVAAGLNATGCHVRDLRVASPAVARFTARDTRCLGGIHLCAADNDPQTLEIHFYDADGIDISAGLEKKVERLYFRQEFRRAFFEQVGEIIYPPRALEYYTAGLSEALDAAGPVDRHFRVVADLGLGPASFVMPQVAAGWGLDLVMLRAFIDSEMARSDATERDALIGQLAHSVDVFQADLGISMDTTAERVTLVTGSGRILDHDTALHAMVSLWCKGPAGSGEGSAVAVPITASRVIEQIAAEHGRAVVRVSSSRRALSAASARPEVGFAGSRRGGYAFPRFLATFDAVMTLGMLLRMLDRSRTTLDEVAADLPAFFLRREAVPCPFDRKGAVMRTMAENGNGGDMELVEGVRMVTDDGWALVLPHATEAVVHVYAEGADDSSAEATLAQYVAAVQDAIARG